MGYRVRNEHGELRFGSFGELRDAYFNELVGPDDEVLEDGSTHWRKASTLPKLMSAVNERPSPLQQQAKWYALAGGVFLVGLGLFLFLNRGLLALLVVFAVAGVGTSVFMWLAHRRKR